MKYFIIAGEASGDLHGSHLMTSLKQYDDGASFEYWGGDMMEAVSGRPLKHIRDLAFMGFWEVVKNLRTIQGYFKECKASIRTFQPDAIILIDYPGFNLRMAEWAKKEGIKVYFYISPQLWAWKGKRIEKVRKFVDRMFVILPFEKEYYGERGIEVSYYGHPLLDIIDDYRDAHKDVTREVFALFPGSRKQEISTMLPLMMKGAQSIDGLFYISRAPSIDSEFYNDLIADKEKFRLFEGTSYELFNQSKAAMVTSGTATLECALFEVPQIVCYSGSFISYLIARQLVNINFISLANLIANREVVKELIQSDCSEENIKTHFQALLTEEQRERIQSGYTELRKMLKTRETKTVPDLIATEIIQRLKHNYHADHA